MPIAHVQSAQNATGSAASLSITVSALTAGNLIVVGSKNATETRTLTPSATGVTFTPVVGPTDHSGGAVNIQAYLWVGVVDTGGATAVVLTLNTGTDVIHGWVAEFSGLATASFTDQTATAESSSAGTSGDITGTVTTTQADELLVGNFALSGQSGTQTAGTDYTLVHTAANRQCIGQWRIVSATGNYSTPITWTDSRDWVAQMVTLKAPGGGDTTNYPFGLDYAHEPAMKIWEFDDIY